MTSAKKTKPAPSKIKARVHAAAEILVRNGNFSLENLANEIGHSLRDITEAAGSLEDIVLAVNARTFERLKLELKDALKGRHDARTSIYILCGCYLCFAMENEPFTEMLFNRRRPSGFKLPAWYQEKVKECFTPLENQIRLLDPHMPPAKISTAARAMWSLIFGIYYLQHNNRLASAGIHSRNELLDFCIDTFLNGLLSRPKTPQDSKLMH